MVTRLDASWHRGLLGKIGIQCRVEDGCVGMGLRVWMVWPTPRIRIAVALHLLDAREGHVVPKRWHRQRRRSDAL